VGLTTVEEWNKGLAAEVLCEGCGPTQVDPKGNCVGVCDGDYFTKEAHPRIYPPSWTKPHTLNYGLVVQLKSAK
jgi:hypothetical protein